MQQLSDKDKYNGKLNIEVQGFKFPLFYFKGGIY